MRVPLFPVFAVLALSSASMEAAHGRMIPWRWSTDLRSSIPRSLQSDSAHSLQDQLDKYIRERRFPQAGRSLEAKISEANAFLERELSSLKTASVGASAAVVYKDQVVLSKGYGLRSVNESSSHVSASTLFQIGSVSKTHIALGIAILVDEGKVAWKDTVIKHYPALELFDKYAEQYVTIGDLLAMNSGLGRALDMGWGSGLYPTDKDLVANLRNVVPPHSLRSENEYANANFAILGQLIEHVTGLEWDQFLKQRIWEPLGMTRTFGSAFEARDDGDMSFGHVSCGGEVLGPFSLVTSPESQLVAGETGGKIAAGSIVSSSDDMAKMLRLLLNKGSVDGVAILKSPKLVSEMTSGKSIANPMNFNIVGHHFVPEGNTLAAGYGFDFVSHALWGHAYFEKGGDTSMHHTRTGFAPDAQLGVVIMLNSMMIGVAGVDLDLLRSYVMGIFLDVPADILDLSLANWRKGAQDLINQQQRPPEVPTCGPIFWKNPKILDLNASGMDALVGVYAAQDSPEYYGSMSIVKTPENRLELRIAKIIASLDLVADDRGAERSFLLGRGPIASLVQITKNAGGKFDVNLGIVFSQQ